MIEKRCILAEIAALFSAIQGLELPPGVTCFGGPTIDYNGDIISGQETLQALPGGPWHEYGQSWTLSDALSVQRSWPQEGHPRMESPRGSGEDGTFQQRNNAQHYQRCRR